MIYSFISVLLWLIHPLHISVTEIEYDEEEKELEIVSRIFADDLETAIRAQRNAPELDLLNPPSNLTTDDLIKNYLLEKVRISLDGKSQTIHYLGFEKEEDALLCYISVNRVKKWETIKVENKVLLERFNDQSNIVHVTADQKIKSLRLSKSKSSGTLSFETSN